MSKGKSSGSTTQTTNAQPWQGAQPYLLGGDANAPGVFPNAAQQFQQGGWSPEQQAQAGQWNQFLQSQQGNAQNQSNAGNALLSGSNNAQITPVGNVADPERIGGWGQIQAQSVDPTQALASLGSINPTQALQNQLSGSANNPYLDQQIAGIGTDISNNLNRNILPGVRGQAVASGQYGGSRQGIAEGLAMSDSNQQLTNAAANIRSGAYESAQNRQGVAGLNLANLGIGNATNNANRDLSAQTSNASNTLQAQMANAANAMQNNQFNANLGLQNNSQSMQNSANNTANSVAGSNILGQGLNYGNNAYGQGLTNLGMGQQQNWQNLNNYANIISSGAGLGRTSESTGPAQGGSNPVAGLLGGGLAGATFGSSAAGASLGLTGPWGAAAGVGLGLLGMR